MQPWSRVQAFRDQLLDPALAALLPWCLGFRYLRHLSRDRRRLDGVGELARLGAAAHLGSAANEPFAQRSLLVRWVDSADAFLLRLRSDRYLQRWVDVEGRWPEPPFVAVNLHYGAGIWGLRHLRRHARHGQFLSIRFDDTAARRSWLQRWVLKFRQVSVERALGAPVIFTGGARKQILAALNSGTSVVALLDSPELPERGTCQADLFGAPIHLHTGVIKLALEAGVPIVPFLMHLGSNGRRQLCIGPAIRAATADAVVAELLPWFRLRVYADPASWHLWPQQASFMQHRQLRPDEPKPDTDVDCASKR